MTTPTSPTRSLDAEQRRFQTLLQPNLLPLLLFARRRCANESDAEDMVQEACVRAWLSFADLRDVEKARPWLYSILRSVLSDTMQKAKRRRQLVSISRLDDIHESLVGGEPDFVFSEVVARMDMDMLREALNMIPEDFAVAVELHDIDGLKYHEIALIEDVPLGTVMSRISRGRRLLAATIAQHRRQWSLGETVTVSPRKQRSERGSR